MFAICIEASHSKGMGHLFRMLNFANYLKKKGEKFLFVINDNILIRDILESHNISYEVVNFEDFDSNWESKIIHKYNIVFWVNDRLDTSVRHSLNISINKNTKLITFDDLGGGAKNSDINICGLFFNNNKLEGKRLLKGIDYLILNDGIDKYKKERVEIGNILVTLGGSDTHGVTIKVLKMLKKNSIKATIHTSIAFEHEKELEKVLTKDYCRISYIPSFIEEFNKYDLAITGGGITPFEANASGLPCIIIANEIFEIANGEFLDDIGSSKFIGYFDNVDESILSNLSILDINSMSKNGMAHLNTKAVERIYVEIMKI
jgi:spore coat polysaccharide biosynthesis predicted glycosyltransferase SpsG